LAKSFDTTTQARVWRGSTPAEARRQGISLAELFRRAIAAALGGVKYTPAKPWMRFSGAVAGGRPDESDNKCVDRGVFGPVRR